MLALDRLTRRFGGQTVLDGISLSVPSGAVACIVGPSGCGKSTLLRLVAGLDRPDDGEIRLGERLLSSPGWALEPRRRRLNMVFQDYALWPHMTVARIVGYGLAHLSRAERDARVRALLDLLRIGALAGRLPAELSGGQQQRVAIARALATDPDLLLFDEPLSNLDVQLRLDMRLEFGALFGRVGKTVLYVTHDPLEACAFADTLVVMKAGRIEQAGSPEALFAAPRSAWVATLAGYETRLKARVRAITAARSVVLDIGGQSLALTADDARLVPGSQVTVMVRPSDIRFAEPGTAGDAALSGTVTGCLFEGRDWRVTVAVAGEALSLTSPARVAPGQAVALVLATGAALLLPEPGSDRRTT